ncbi:MAG: hypothetical protein US76_03950 [Parcubacteria group bacterium GW2011_GWA2_38_13b]|nr:MAG: hypothetical protein US76_03950 [Parcubacteria group bacterium GW2011_GWA2_38_13b]
MRNILSIKNKSIFQFFRFVAVGLLNTGIDFGILNILVWFFGIAIGWPVAVFNIVATGIAMVNSYFLNKYWAFKKTEKNNTAKEGFLFVIFTFLGMGINTGAVYCFVNFFDPLFGINETLWLNLGKIFATVLSLFWNFFWYKFIVFRNKGN